ncbi:hypothetical protein HanHA300_Chr09g0330751 [Helianthus annuus]|nr:hypothetical protein HanHA300_Chr09g0330751 [Helianthus annuus]KAJ0708584.1 hypothetical protein HanLR1_Chr09g0331021 [Helianthus annuus]
MTKIPLLINKIHCIIFITIIFITNPHPISVSRSFPATEIRSEKRGERRQEREEIGEDGGTAVAPSLTAAAVEVLQVMAVCFLATWLSVLQVMLD